LSFFSLHEGQDNNSPNFALNTSPLNPPPLLNNVDNNGSKASTHLELTLLAVVVLALVLQMGVVVWFFGFRRRKASYYRQRKENPLAHGASTMMSGEDEEEETLVSLYGHGGSLDTIEEAGEEKNGGNGGGLWKEAYAGFFGERDAAAAAARKGSGGGEGGILSASHASSRHGSASRSRSSSVIMDVIIPSLGQVWRTVRRGSQAVVEAVGEIVGGRRISSCSGDVDAGGGEGGVRSRSAFIASPSFSYTRVDDEEQGVGEGGRRESYADAAADLDVEAGIVGLDRESINRERAAIGAVSGFSSLLSADARRRLSLAMDGASSGDTAGGRRGRVKRGPLEEDDSFPLDSTGGSYYSSGPDQGVERAAASGHRIGGSRFGWDFHRRHSSCIPEGGQAV